MTDVADLQMRVHHLEVAVISFLDRLVIVEEALRLEIEIREDQEASPSLQRLQARVDQLARDMRFGHVLTRAHGIGASDE